VQKHDFFREKIWLRRCSFFKIFIIFSSLYFLLSCYIFSLLIFYLSQSSFAVSSVTCSLNFVNASANEVIQVEKCAAAAVAYCSRGSIEAPGTQEATKKEGN